METEEERTARLRCERPHLFVGGIVAEEGDGHYHVTRSREEVDRDEAWLCDDPNCRHAGQFMRHARRCPPRGSAEGCDFSMLHAPTCHCALCDPEGAAQAETWKQRGEREERERRERAEAARANMGRNARDAFLADLAARRGG